MDEALIRSAKPEDIKGVVRIYEKIHAAEEAGRLTTGWVRGVYPVWQTAAEAQKRGDLFVLANQQEILGCAVINQIQHPSYKFGKWETQAPASSIMVLHTLAVDPDLAGQGLGRKFIGFYTQYASSSGCSCLRMDTNAKNVKARKIYARYGFREAGSVAVNFNGIDGVELILLEKDLNKILH